MSSKRNIWAISELPCATASKRVFVQNTYMKISDFHENEHVRGTHFHMNGFARTG